MLYVSHKYKELILGPVSFPQIFANGAIELYSGAVPVDADAPLGAATLLGRISNNGQPWVSGSAANGLKMINAGVLVLKDPTQSWVLVPIATGAPTFFRLLANAPDDGLLSYTHARIQGSVSADPADDMTISSGTITLGQNKPFDSFTYTLPPVIGL